MKPVPMKPVPTPLPAPPARRALTSPCVSMCRIEPASGWCEGCLRTLDEIASWGSMPETRRAEVWTALAKRRAQRDASAG